MKERSITEGEVMECLENWETRYTDKKGNYIYKAIVNGRGIKVVKGSNPGDPVITAADY
ncbi:MAG: hypothetical protein JXA46_08905 [Dehalococcoidales bacterium]|nr:hypothetical protein [Dehalococcoidales bacterium]